MRVAAAPRRAARGKEGTGMSLQAVLLPVFVEVALTFVLMFWMARARVTAVSGGECKIKDIALRQPNWPVTVTQIGNAYHNQLELPLLFYVLTIFAYLTKLADLLFIVMAWLFVLSRLAHAYVFVTDNNVPRRFRAFAVGVFTLLAMWIIFAVRVLLAV
jgi:hypothetical protein